VILSDLTQAFQETLFPFLEKCFDGPLTPRLAQLVSVLEVLRIEDYVGSPHRFGTGRPLIDRRPLARAFVAKAVYQLATTEMLIQMLKLQPALRFVCGFSQGGRLPSEATFSRAFSEFAATDLGNRVLDASVRKYVGDQIVMHASHDSTEIDAREKAKPKPKDRNKKKETEKQKRERVRSDPKRVTKQLDQTTQEAIAELPKDCDWGAKKKPGGHTHYWQGYKAHISWADDNIPLAMITTSASLHDSQAAIPLIRVAADRAIILYDLMDSAYDNVAISKAVADLQHQAIIDFNRRRGEEKQMDPADAVRYQKRSTAERGNSRFKDEFGARFVRVKGHAKVHMHLMFGLLALFADQLLKPSVGL